jgi:hypothetical protein
MVYPAGEQQNMELHTGQLQGFYCSCVHTYIHTYVCMYVCMYLRTFLLLCMHATTSVRLVPVYHYCSHVTLSHSFRLMSYPAFQSVAAIRLTPQRSPFSGFPTTTVRVSLARDVNTKLGAFQPAVARCNHAVHPVHWLSRYLQTEFRFQILC